MPLISSSHPISPTTPITGNPWERGISARDESRLNDRRIFSSVLSRAKQDAPIDPEQAATEGAENLISVALVQPILAKMRESSFAVEPFKQTSGQKSFNGMMDNALALKMVRSGNWPLVDKVKERVLSKSKAGEVGTAAVPVDLRGDDARKGGDVARQAFEARPQFNSRFGVK